MPFLYTAAELTFQSDLLSRYVTSHGREFAGGDRGMGENNKSTSVFMFVCDVTMEYIITRYGLTPRRACDTGMLKRHPCTFVVPSYDTFMSRVK